MKLFSSLFTRSKKDRENHSTLYVAEFRYIRVLRALSLVINGLLATFLGAVLFFTYDKVYTALEQANAIVVLQSEIGVETINFPLLQRVQDQWEHKFSLSELQIERNPFIKESVVTPEGQPDQQAAITQ